MPIYEYGCIECGLIFEKLKKLSESQETHACPECATAAPKRVTTANFAFAHKPVGGPRPQNTGIHSIDYNADRTIGRDAEERKKVIQERQAYKRSVIRDNPGSTGHDLSRVRDTEGGYRVMKPEERKAAEAGRKVHRQAVNAIESTVTKTGKG